MTRYAEAIALVDQGKASEQVVRAVTLWRQGLNGPQIAERMGISRSAAYELLDDPLRAKARKRKPHGACEDCGAPTSYGVGGPYRRCSACEFKRRRAAARERIIEALRDWNARYGSPPSAHDWNMAPSALARTHPEARALRLARHRERDWPNVSTALYCFGSWNAAIEAASLSPLPRGHRRDPEAWKRHLGGGPMPKALTAQEIIDREIDRNEAQQKKLADRVEELRAANADLLRAKAALNGGTK